MIEMIGFAGSFLVSINLVPQIIRIVQKKSGKNISYFSIGINIFASIFMLIYSVNKVLYPVIVSNVLVFITSLIILILKKYYSTIPINTESDNNKNHIAITDIEKQ
jgi:uncharacterized protein with PQ loop repeat